MEKKDLKINIQKMMRISTDKCESLNFYKYLCQQIGSEEVVRIRRFAFCISDMAKFVRYDRIASGSKAEGLDLNGSDLDLMFHDTQFKVYESETEVNPDGMTVPLIMNTEETQPCFTQLRLIDHHHPYAIVFDNLWQKNHLEWMLSSEQYKLVFKSFFAPNLTKLVKMHGPCISDTNEIIDIASCIKCDKWICQAQPWVSRTRTSWPAPEIISKIISYGVLFVPIGCKESVNEDLEWRISFSVAEKFLIYSFSQTQLLCYALLKILLKEVIEKYADMKTLLCSYFLKTVLFWISEEAESNFWRPDNIIPCFMACLQRLMYCVRYSTLLHYFIPENNLFYLRFNAMNKQKLESILDNLYAQGIHCFDSTATLHDYHKQSYNISDLPREMIFRILQKSFKVPRFGYEPLIHFLLHHSRTSFCRGLLALYLSKSCWYEQDVLKDRYFYQFSSENKRKYIKFKYDLSHLLIGVQSDAVSGLLVLASFFYRHNNYVASLTVINHALQKYTDEKIFDELTTSEITYIQKHQLNLMKKEKLYTVLKVLTIHRFELSSRSSIVPHELQLDFTINPTLPFHPLSFAYFLCFLCSYHLHDFKSCRIYLQQLEPSYKSFSLHANCPALSTPIMCGIANQLLGESNRAKQYFQIADMFDHFKMTSAALRLSRNF